MAYMLRDVALIDGLAETRRDHMDVLVDGERISTVDAHDPARAIAAAATVINGAGRTLLPGLIDAHAHYTFDPTEG